MQIIVSLDCTCFRYRPLVSRYGFGESLVILLGEGFLQVDWRLGLELRLLLLGVKNLRISLNFQGIHSKNRYCSTL